MANSNLDPEPNPRDSPDTPEDNEPDTVATPEGDGEYPPDVPLTPSPEGLQRLTRPRRAAPQSEG